MQDNIAASNAALAEEFRQIVSSRAGRNDFASAIEAIKKAPVDIRVHFEQHQSLDLLGVRGIGQGTKALLTELLKHGVEEARAAFQRERRARRDARNAKSDAAARYSGVVRPALSEGGRVEPTVRYDWETGDGQRHSYP